MENKKSYGLINTLGPFDLGLSSSFGSLLGLSWVNENLFVIFGQNGQGSKIVNY